MRIERETWKAIIRLAVVISIGATVLAIGLDAAGGVSRTALVLGVMVVGFVASWIVSGRASRPAPHHRVVVIPVRHHVA